MLWDPMNLTYSLSTAHVQPSQQKWDALYLSQNIMGNAESYPIYEYIYYPLSYLTIIKPTLTIVILLLLSTKRQTSSNSKDIQIGPTDTEVTGISVIFTTYFVFS